MICNKNEAAFSGDFIYLFEAQVGCDSRVLERLVKKKFPRKRAPFLVLYRFFLAAFVQRSPQSWTSVFVLAMGRRARHKISGDFHGDTARKYFLALSTSTIFEGLSINSATFEQTVYRFYN